MSSSSLITLSAEGMGWLFQVITGILFTANFDLFLTAMMIVTGVIGIILVLIMKPFNIIK